MKVLTINGSPNENGNTAQALELAAGPLCAQGIEVEALHIGNTVHPCRACYACMRKRDGKCVIVEDRVNEIYQKLLSSAGALFGTPVYYGGIAGGMKSFLDRLFYIDSSHQGARLAHRVAAPVVVTRRGGGLPTIDGLMHYFTVSGMVVPGSVSWPVAFGMLPGEIAQDQEGRQGLETLGQNVAWLVQALDTPQARSGVPAQERRIKTNFIR